MNKQLSVYIHVPFCINAHKGTRADVCEAATQVRRDYQKALEREVESALGDLEGRELVSVCLGGGASMLRPDDLARLVLKIERAAKPVRGMEVTVRFLPQTMGSATFSGLNACSFNRLSVEALCYKDRDFEALGSPLRYGEIEDGMNMASIFKYPNVDIEVLYGFPGQTVGGLLNALEVYTNFGHVAHITLVPYLGEGRLSDDGMPELYSQGVEYLASRGFANYAARAFCKPNKECRHLYYRAVGTDWLGFGAGASTVMDGFSYRNTPDIGAYIANAGDFEKTVVDPVRIDPSTDGARRLALRMILAEPFAGTEFDSATLEPLVKNGLAIMSDGLVRPTQAALCDPGLVAKALKVG